MQVVCSKAAAVAWLVLIGVAAPSLGQVTPIPEASRFGIVDDHIATSDDALQRARNAGVGWVHYVLYWSVVNPAPGVYDWSAPDLEIQRMANLGLNVYVRISTPPTWTTGASYANGLAILFCLDESQPGGLKQHPDCTGPNASERRPGFRQEYTPNQYPPGYDRSGDFRTFVGVAVNRYKDRVRAWGFGAEIHTGVFWRGNHSQFFDEILRPGYETVKSIDAALLVAGPDDDLPSSLQDTLDIETAHGTRAFDVLTFHILRHAGGTIERIDDEVAPIIAARRQGRPFWFTELGFRSAGGVADDVQAAWLAEMLGHVVARPWIDKTFVYRLKDATAEDFGLLNEDDTPKPAYTSVQQFLATQSIPRFYYLAEGATKGFFNLDVALANPYFLSAPVKVSFLKPDGTVVLATPTIGPRSRLTIAVDTIAGLESTDVSVVVESTTGRPIGVERTMFWDQTWYGGHTDTAVQAPATTWYFAEGSQGFFDTYVLLANSNIVPASVTVTFLLQDADPVQKTFTVGATSRAGFCACEFEELAMQSFGILVESNQPIIAERAMYFGGNPFWTAGHESAGVTAPSTSWFMAEGRTGPVFDVWVLISNPNDDAASVDVEFITSDGTTVPYPGGPIALAGKGRTSIYVDGIAGLEDVAVSTRITSDVPVVAERAMYWPGTPGEWFEAHNSFGMTETGTRWVLAEGRSGTGGSTTSNPHFETYILVYNTSETAANVTVTYLPESGASFTVAYVVSKGRFDVVDALTDPRLANQSFGALIQSDQPIVVERAMYWQGQSGRPWGWGGSNATGVKLP